MSKKRINILLAGMLLLVISVGATFAWWTASTQVTQTINMGNLAIEATVEQLGDNENYEPGLTVEQDGTVTNTGTIETLISVDSSSTVESKGSEGTETAISIAFKPLGGDGYWFKDASGRAYVLLSPGETAEVEIVSSLNGSDMDNTYMDSTVNIVGDFHATQVLDGALEAEFGIVVDDLIDYEENFSRGVKSEGMKRLHDLTKRGK